MISQLPERLLVPTIHLNGTSREELIEQIRNAHSAITDAMSALRKACPNGRDYYIHTGNSVINEAIEQHMSRCKRLESVGEELHRIWEGILDQ